MIQLINPLPLLDEISALTDGVHCEKGTIVTTTTTSSCDVGIDPK